MAVSIFPLWDLARRIGGDALDVALVLPAGRTEHAYDPTPVKCRSSRRPSWSCASASTSTTGR
ncbi:MAG: hypothetical protein IPJ34_31190 [Myxococcales bacterium]|nr:hypothetical protein [Myxococcales bacterium]